MSLSIFAIGLITGGGYQDDGSHVKEIVNPCNLLDEASTQFLNLKFVGTLRAQGLGRGSY